MLAVEGVSEEIRKWFGVPEPRMTWSYCLVVCRANIDWFLARGRNCGYRPGTAG